MATLQVYQNAQEMAEILAAVDSVRYADRIARIARRQWKSSRVCGNSCH